MGHSGGAGEGGGEVCVEGGTGVLLSDSKKRKKNFVTYWCCWHVHGVAWYPPVLPASCCGVAWYPSVSPVLCRGMAHGLPMSPVLCCGMAWCPPMLLVSCH